MSAIDEIKTVGYTVVENALTSDVCDMYVKKLEETFEKCSKHYIKSVNQEHKLNTYLDDKLIYNVHNKDPEFLNLTNIKEVLEVVRPVLSEGSYCDTYPIHLRQITARSPLPGRGHQQLHNDSYFPASTYTLTAIAVVALEDMTIANGTTRLIPGSHRFTGYPENGKKYDEEIQLPLKKGSVLMYDASVWHGGCQNNTQDSRWSILLTYTRWFVKQAFDFYENTPLDIYEAATEEQRELLGFSSVPPKDEFTRISARTSSPIKPRGDYSLPLH